MGFRCLGGGGAVGELWRVGRGQLEAAGPEGVLQWRLPQAGGPPGAFTRGQHPI